MYEGDPHTLYFALEMRYCFLQERIGENSNMLQKSHTPIGQKTRDKRAIYLLITLLLAVVGVAFAISLQASSQVHTQAGEPPRIIGDLPSGDPDAAERFSQPHR